MSTMEELKKMSTMEESKINELGIPQSLKELSLRKLIEIQKLNGNNAGSMQYQNQFLSTILNVTEVDLMDMSVDDYYTAVSLLQPLFEDLEQIRTKPRYDIELKGTKFHLVKFTELSTAEFIDFNTLADEMKLNNSPENISVILALIYKKIGSDIITPETIKENSEFFLDNMDADTALSAIVFFSTSAIEYIKSIKGSLPSQAAEQMDKMMMMLKPN